MSNTSVSSSQFRSPYVDLMPRGLVVAYEYNPDRWHMWTIFAAIAIPNCDDLPPQTWVGILDRIEAQLSLVIPPLMPVCPKADASIG